jgi:DNA-binding MarR family transcriptional regulator
MTSKMVTGVATLDDVAGSTEAGGCPTPQELALLEQWNILQSAFRRLTDQLLCDVGVSTGLAPSSFQVLWFLLTTPGRCAPMYQLAETLGFTTAGTTKVADRLAEAGLLERRPQPTDRRVILAALTENGCQTATTAARTFAQALRERVVGPLGEEQFTSLAAAIAGLHAAT